jgi:hypothetical protein
MLLQQIMADDFGFGYTAEDADMVKIKLRLNMAKLGCVGEGGSVTARNV